MSKRALLVTVAAVGFFSAACGSQEAEGTQTPSSTPSGSAAATTTQSSEAKDSGYQPFTPATDPCGVVAPERLAPQGAAPIKARAMDDDGTGIQQCNYEDAGGHDVLNVKLFKNSTGAANFRAIHLRILKSEGTDIYVMKDEPNECGVGLLGPEDNIAQFEFEPGDAAVAAAALSAGQTWCDFSAPVIVEANKKLGWTK
ncbi:Uncharacterised protein [Mycolicibacterium phlei]|nr:Uncharacterised protein [Mycolicibacterium phlei]